MTIKINFSYVVVVLIIGALGYWFYTGLEAMPEPETTDISERIRVQSRPIVTVEELPFERIDRVLELSGRTEEYRQVTVRSEIGGRVQRLPLDKGALVQSGDLLVELDPDDLNAKLRQGQVELKAKRIEFDADKRLVSEQLASRSKLAQSESALELARANLESLQLQLGKTVVVAPFGGVLETLDVELGSFVTTGDAIGTIYQYDPILVVAYINESDVNKLRLGMDIRALMVDGEEVFGKLAFIANSGEQDARTYRIEVELPNKNRRIRAQMTADIFIEFAPVGAFKLSPSILSLNDGGLLGVKTVDDDMLVQFAPVQLERMQTNDFWVSGIQQDSKVITIGHGFVSPGDRVDAFWPGGDVVGGVGSLDN